MDSESKVSKSLFFFSAEMSRNKHWLPLPEFLLGKMKSSALKEVEICKLTRRKLLCVLGGEGGVVLGFF